MHFTKMEGLGNDYVYVDMKSAKIKDPAALAVRVSDRHFGIGADGLILICPSTVAHARMEMYNADGSRGRMCGNGIRCVGKYIYEHGWTQETKIRIETDAGIKSLVLFVEDGKVAEVSVDMGEAQFAAEKVPVLLDNENTVDVPLCIGGENYLATMLSVGNPHCVVFMDEVEELAIDQIGPAFAQAPIFPEGVNTEFVKVLDAHTIRMRVFERGSGETMACGTGACAAACAAICKGLVQSPVTVRLNGGDLKIAWEGEGRPIVMTGPAKEVFGGDIDVESE